MITRRRLLSLGVAAGAGLAVSACTSRAGSPATQVTGAARDAATAITHIHGIGRDPRTGVVLIATHQGLFRREAGAWLATGPVVDLMGFTITPDGTYLASGHPGAGVDLPQPVGLIESTDSGKTWRVRSRGGQSDFHALAAGPSAVLAVDGRLRLSTDRRSWRELAIPAQPHSIAVSPTSSVVLATTERGLLRSEDLGSTWSPLQPPRLTALVAWADDRTVVGVTVDGTLVTSADAGSTWTSGKADLGEVHALAASRTSSGAVEALVVSGTSVLVSTDGGDTTTELP